MKITSIVLACSDENKVTFRTIPPLTQEVFEIFDKAVATCGFPPRHVADGFLVFSPPLKEGQAIPFLEEELTKAENEVPREDFSEARKLALNYYSQLFGLRVE